MKSYLRSSLLFILAIGCSLLLCLPLSGQPSSPPLSALQFDVEQFKATLDRGDVAEAVQQLERGWKQQFDDYYQNRVRAQLLPTDQMAVSLNQIAQRTGKRSALLYAISVPEQLETILLLPDGQLVHHREPAATAEAVTDVTREFRLGLVNVTSRPSDYLPAAQQLYQWLIQPFAAQLQAQQIDNLIFCLGRGLRSVPMAALHDGDRFLTETYGVTLIPAFNLLDRHPARLDGLRVLAMGASEFQQEAPLPAVPIELAAIAQLWDTEVFLNEQFTITQLREQRSEYPFGIVHLATHAAFEPGAVGESYIRFWNRPLRLTQLRELDLRQPIVQLLVLSACRTALGDANAELGFAGLAVQSGAKAALASLWAVSDAATVVTMVDFYKNLQESPIKVEALRQTQLAMLHDQLHLESPSIQQVIRGIEIPASVENSISRDLSHPYYWAGFTMIGNPW
jgi:CHAT domain-containing protein